MMGEAFRTRHQHIGPATEATSSEIGGLTKPDDWLPELTSRSSGAVRYCCQVPVPVKAPGQRTATTRCPALNLETPGPHLTIFPRPVADTSS